MENHVGKISAPSVLGEGKRKKFVELAEKRVISAMKALSLVGNLANTNNYKYNEADVKKIVKVLSDEVKEVESRFKTGRSEDKVFKL